MQIYYHLEKVNIKLFFFYITERIGIFSKDFVHRLEGNDDGEFF
jgi:hypothetical protein